MTKFAIDSNLYVSAFRDTEAADNLRAFYSSHAPNTYLCSVVLHELAVGAGTPAVNRWVEAMQAPFIRTQRVITPSHRAWSATGHAVARFAVEHGRDRRTLPRSLVNDILIAATCRESGVTLVTENSSDFKIIQRLFHFNFAAPWPEVVTN